MRRVPVRVLFFILFTVSTFTLIESVSAQPPIPTPPLPPIFTDLTITPAEIEPGNEVTISFTITNSDNQTFNYTAIMQIGELNFPIDVELEAYEAKTVSRSITQYIPGDYNVTIDSLEGSFTVKFHDIPTPPLPPYFSNLTVTPSEIERGDNVTISVDIRNTDSQSITYGVTMWIENAAFPPPFWPPYDVTLRIWVDLEAYESKTVSQNITLDMIGEYHVWVKGLTGIFTVGTWPPEPPPPLPPILSNLTITPDEIERGDNVTISFDIENYGSPSQTYGVDMYIENVNDPPPTWPPYNVTLRIWVDLGAYESKTVSRTITMDTGGDFNVTVSGMTGSFKVGTWPPGPPLKPAELVLSDLSIEPEEAELWGDIDVWTFKITANVANIGEQEGMDKINLRIDGSIVDWRTVELKAGEQATIIYDVTRGVGSYIVEVDGLTGGFEVKAPPKPAEFEFSNLRIFYPGVTPPEVEVGQTVTVTVSIEADNVGELEGSRTVELKVDGEVIDSKEVTLEGGASATVLFELTRGEGTHEIEVEGFTESFTVNPKPSFWDKIPGFTYESIILGLMTGVFVLWSLSRRKMTILSPRNHILSFSKSHSDADSIVRIRIRG